MNILLVEDNPDEVLITQEAFEGNKKEHNLHIVPDGLEAIKFLKQQDPYGSKPKPSIILLDLNLPKKSGREILIDLKKDESIKGIPVIILSTSSSENDIKFSYQHHANGYIIKPLDYFEFVNIINKTIEYWDNIMTLPERNHQ